MDIEMEKLCISFARLTTKSEVELLCDKLQKLTVRKGEKRRRNQGDGDDDAPDAPPLKIQRRIPVARKILVQGKLFYCLWRKPKLIYHEKWRLRCFYIPRHVVRDRNMKRDWWKKRQFDAFLVPCGRRPRENEWEHCSRFYYRKGKRKNVAFY